MSLLAVAEQRILESQNLTVGEVFRSRILQCDHSEAIAEVATRMHTAACSSIIVMEKGRPAGIWTERDALAIDFSDFAATSRPIRDVMSSPIKTVEKSTPLHEVSVRFRRDRVRHYLVVDGEVPLGVVTQSDVVMNQGIEHYLHLRSVDTAISRSPLVLDASMPLEQAASIMREVGVDAALVDYGDECGIFTERDLVRLIADGRLASLVGDLASRPLITVAPTVSLYRARNTLLDSRVRHVGVYDPKRDEVIGLVSFSDILSGIEVAYVKELRQALEERNRALTASRRSLQLADKVIESSLEGIIITDADQRIVHVNPAFTRLLGYALEEVVGQKPSMFSSGRHDKRFYQKMWKHIAEKGHWQGEVWNRRANGEIFPELLTITAILDEKEEVTHYAALFSDISELKENEAKIRHLAYYDPLTGLPNRRLFQDRLGVAIAHAHRSEAKMALIFVDLDRFKRINDSLGHEAGDTLLTAVATRLSRSVREDDTVARLGGDEFVLILSDLEQVDDAAATARRICATMNAPLDLGPGTEPLVVTCSLGVSLYPDDGTTMEELVRNADSAMYRAKDLGRNTFQLYSPEINARSMEHLAMENNLRQALDNGELEVHYQPLVRAADAKVAAAEALLRWNHPSLGRVAPGDFIPLAEETGLIVPIGEWVLETVCAQLEAWVREGRPRLNVSVNISANQFRNRDFPAAVQAILSRYDIDPEFITLELIETVLVEDAVENIRTLNALRALGVGLDLDDFGTGYSSLNYLKRFPINRLKIDRVFVRDLGRTDRDNAIVAAIIQLAHSLGLEVVGEGVEHEQQLAFLEESGCDWLQGFHYGAAVSAEEFTRLYLESHLNS